MADATDTIMTLDDLAAYIKLSKSSLYKLCQAGKVPGTKVGRTLAVPQGRDRRLDQERRAAHAAVRQGQGEGEEEEESVGWVTASQRIRTR